MIRISNSTSWRISHIHPPVILAHLIARWQSALFLHSSSYHPATMGALTKSHRLSNANTADEPSRSTTRSMAIDGVHPSSMGARSQSKRSTPTPTLTAIKEISSMETRSMAKRRKITAENDSSTSLSTLELLPRELIAMVIEHTPEAVYDLRLVCLPIFLMLNFFHYYNILDLDLTNNERFRGQFCKEFITYSSCQVPRNSPSI